MVFFESPRRLAATLAELAAAFGPDRPAAVCRELTKTHEEVRRGHARRPGATGQPQGVLGEITLVVAGRRPAAARGRDRRPDGRGGGRRGGAGRAAAQGGDRRRGRRDRPARRDVYDAVGPARSLRERRRGHRRRASRRAALR